MSPFLVALIQDLVFFSIFIGIGAYLAKRRNRSAWWGLIGPTLIGFVVILLLPKKANSGLENTPAISAN